MRVWIGGIEIGGGADPNDDVIVTDGGISGWYDLPGVKTSLAAGGGAAGSSRPRGVVYSPRTATFNLAHLGDTRESAIEVYNRFNTLGHSLVEVRVDDVDDTSVEGWIETSFGSRWESTGLFTVTVTAPDPTRYSTEAQNVTVLAGARRGGIDYPIDYPIDYGSDDGAIAIATNRGTTTSWPVIEVQGTLPGGFMLEDGAGRVIDYTGDVWPGAPVTVDCRHRTIMVGGVPRTELATRRAWFDIPAGGSLTVSLHPRTDTPVGQTFATLIARDAYI
jgi:hypothetical protein